MFASRPSPSARRWRGLALVVGLFVVGPAIGRLADGKEPIGTKQVADGDKWFPQEQRTAIGQVHARIGQFLTGADFAGGMAAIDAATTPRARAAAAQALVERAGSLGGPTSVPGASTLVVELTLEENGSVLAAPRPTPLDGVREIVMSCMQAGKKLHWRLCWKLVELPSGTR